MYYIWYGSDCIPKTHYRADKKALQCLMVKPLDSIYALAGLIAAINQKKKLTIKHTAAGTFIK